MAQAKATIVGEVLQVRMGRKRIELIIAPQDDRPEPKQKRGRIVYSDGEIESELIEQETASHLEPVWSFYVSKSVFEALGRPTVESEVLITLTRLH
ncbi:MAG: hypothetical protein QXG05_02050 [Nitrososphaerota archaeon]